MTRAECEAILTDLMKTAIDVYKAYNPDGTYLALFYKDRTMVVNNRYWGPIDDDPAGEDHDRPINVVWEEEADEEVQDVS